MKYNRLKQSRTILYVKVISSSLTHNYQLMKCLTPVFFLLFTSIISFGQSRQDFVDTDIRNFWQAYDKIMATKDSAMQYRYLQTLFLDKGTPGLKAIMENRGYTAASYIEAIHNYPRFWTSVRSNTNKVKDIPALVRPHLVKLRSLYPALKPATTYFTIGALRTNGTGVNGMVLIGSELAFADKTTVADEFPGRMAAARRSFFDANSVNDLVLLNLHEYIHTNQKEMVQNLLSICLYEGVAEFISCHITGITSAVPAVAFGKKNEITVKAKFEKDMFNVNSRNAWLWSDAPNDFNTRDLGYYIGYALCEKYFNKAINKKEAIKTLIELDYTKEDEVGKIVDGTGYFSAPLDTLYSRFEAQRPVVTGIEQFSNGNQNTDPSISKVTVNFSAPMDTLQRGFDYGPLGENNVLSVRRYIGFSADRRSVTFEVAMLPGRRYQVTLTNRFRSAEGFPLKAYLIDISTAEK